MIAVAALLVCCTGEGVTVQEPGGLFTFAADRTPDDERAEGMKALWIYGDVRIAVQRIRRTPYNSELSLAEVAEALSERFELEDIEGELVVSPCTVDGRSVQCLDGSTQSEAGEVRRRGFLIEGDGELVLLEVIGQGAGVDASYERVLRTLRWKEDERG